MPLVLKAYLIKQNKILMKIKNKCNEMAKKKTYDVFNCIVNINEPVFSK
jgi:hypothetical protein